MSDLYGGMGNNFPNNNNGMEEEKKKKMMIIGGVTVVGVIVILMIIVAVISSINNQKNNLYVDGSLVAKLNTTNNIFYIDENNVPYVCVEKIAPKLGYQFYNGEYGTGSEDKTHCYVRNEYEIALLQMDSNLVYKTLTSDATSTFDTYTMSYRVKRINDLLYISLPTMQKVFNVKYTHNAEKNTLAVSTLPALYQKYDTVAKNAGYHEMSKDFSNQKALVEDMIVVVTKEKQIGVISTKDKSTIIGTKYPDMIYCEGMGEFIVQQNGKYGVLVRSTGGETAVKVAFEYDNLKLIDNKIGLYLAQSGKKYGVLDKTGRIIINLEYDAIGIENSKMFPMDNIKNSYVLYENCIPVKQNDKWGMFDITGKNILPVEKYGFGCAGSATQTSQNVLLIPASEGAEGIVYSRKTSTNKIKYGIIDINGTPRVPDTFDSIYRTISAGEVEYNMLFGNTVLLVSDRMKESSSSGSNSGTIQIN